MATCACQAPAFRAGAKRGIIRDEMAMEWMDELRAALDREQSAMANDAARGDAPGTARGVPRVATLATVDGSDGAGRRRCRGRRWPVADRW